MRAWAPTLPFILLAFGCKNGEQPAPKGDPAAASASAAAVAASAASAPSPSTSADVLPPPANVPGKLPVDYPEVSTTAHAGDKVLAPPRGFLDEALESGGEHQAFIFYLAELARAGPKGSLIRTRRAITEGLPNALIIPLPKGARAKPGDLVLTAWAAGAGMQRAVVVEGGSATSPRVRYLDLDLDHPSGWGEKTDRLPADTFRVLTTPGEPGTTVACQAGKGHSAQIVVHRQGDKLLGLGFAGKLSVFPAASCQTIALHPELKLASEVWVPVVGVFTPAKVKKVEAEPGRVKVEYAHGKEKVERSAPMIEVAVGLGETAK